MLAQPCSIATTRAATPASATPLDTGALRPRAGCFCSHRGCCWWTRSGDNIPPRMHSPMCSSSTDALVHARSCHACCCALCAIDHTLAQVEGRENIPDESTPAVYCANHESYMVRPVLCPPAPRHAPETPEGHGAPARRCRGCSAAPRHRSTNSLNARAPFAQARGAFSPVQPQLRAASRHIA